MTARISGLNKPLYVPRVKPDWTPMYASGHKVILTWGEWFKSWGLWALTLGCHTRSQNKIYCTALRAHDLKKAEAALRNGASVDCISPEAFLTAETINTFAFAKAQQEPYQERWLDEVIDFRYTYNPDANTISTASTRW